MDRHAVYVADGERSVPLVFDVNAKTVALVQSHEVDGFVRQSAVGRRHNVFRLPQVKGFGRGLSPGEALDADGHA